jgi:hypothetical protein
MRLSKSLGCSTIAITIIAVKTAFVTVIAVRFAIRSDAIVLIGLLDLSSYSDFKFAIVTGFKYLRYQLHSITFINLASLGYPCS